jgi:hypothetical protein
MAVLAPRLERGAGWADPDVKRELWILLLRDRQLTGQRGPIFDDRNNSTQNEKII